MSNRFDYSVSLSVKHPKLHPNAIADTLRLQAKHSWAVGEPRKTPKGTPLEGVRQESYCSFTIGEGDDGALAECLSTAVNRLAPQRKFLRELRDTGGSLMFYVFWYPNGDTGEVFATSLLRDLADIGIELGINVYDDRASD